VIAVEVLGAIGDDVGVLLQRRRELGLLEAGKQRQHWVGHHTALLLRNEEREEGGQAI
jgi:hypothetical protein